MATLQSEDGRPMEAHGSAEPSWTKTTVFGLLGFVAGLPFATLLGTLYARLTQAEVSVAAIGVLSWAGLAYGFKFLWSPIVLSAPPFFSEALGRRRSWLIACQAVIFTVIELLAIADPARHLVWIALGSVAGAFASATQDIVIDAWRIERAETADQRDMIAAAHQFGYRSATFVAGAGALWLADRTNWGVTFAGLAVIGFLAFVGAVLVPDRSSTADAPNRGAVGVRNAAVLRPDEALRRPLTLCVLSAWVLSGATLLGFMALSVIQDPPPNVRQFTWLAGPWIILACVAGPGLAAAFLLRRPMTPSVGRTGLDRLYDVLLAPLVELTNRLRWWILPTLGLVLTYRFTDAVWGSFAYPFYLGTDHGALGHSLTDVALASKIFGALMTLAGVPLGGAALWLIGRGPALALGAFLAAATNLLYADLALGAPRVDAFMTAAGLYDLFDALAEILKLDLMDAGLARLMTVIAAENLSGGFATAVYVACLSGLVSKRYAGVQYALLGSLTLLLGSLGRGALGAMIETDGFAAVFVLTAWLGGVAVIFSLVEWRRGAATAAKAA